MNNCMTSIYYSYTSFVFFIYTKTAYLQYKDFNIIATHLSPSWTQLQKDFKKSIMQPTTHTTFFYTIAVTYQPWYNIHVHNK